MTKASRLGRGLLLLVPLAGLLCAGGCPPQETTPPPEAVLEGTWELLTEADDLGQTFLVFDALGDLDQVRYTIGNVTFTDNNPRGTTTVNGDMVMIDATFAGSGQVFNGTLNADNTQIDGEAGSVFRFGNLTVDVDNGNMTLVRQ